MEPANTTAQDTGAAEYRALKNAGLKEFFDRVKTERQRMSDFVVPAHALHVDPDGHLVLHNAPNPDMTDDEIESVYGYGLDAEAKRVIRAGHDMTFDRLPLFDSQLAGRIGIPKRYYDRMATDAKSIGLFADNVNHWLRHDDESRNFLFRTLRPDDGGVGMARALLSDKYLLLNNYDLVLTRQRDRD